MKIGLEVHVALPTKTKLFCSDLAYENLDEPNSNVCPVCLGLPGAKPVLNKKALEISANIANALNCRINSKIWFVRKVYFYPDLPKGYQITQLDGSIGLEGYVELSNKKVRIRRVQIEEDPAKIIREKDYSLIDFNRSGIPLNEIVTDPDITSLDELREFMTELRSILYYQGVDINQELKADLNISLAENRVEVKNVTGINNLIGAAEYEIKRQTSLINEGKYIKTETRTYKEDLNETFSSREKETEEEYGFIFEPDLTFYTTSGIKLERPVIARKIAEELSHKTGYNSKVLMELIAFNKFNLNLLVDSSKEDLKRKVALLEKFASFGVDSFSKEEFDRLLSKDFDGMDKASFISALKGEAMGSNVDKEEVEDYIRKTIAEDESLIKKISKNDKAIDFLVGKVKNRYHLSAAESIELIKKVIKAN